MSSVEPSESESQAERDLEGPSPRVAAAAIRDAIDAVGRERPELAARLAELVRELEVDQAGQSTRSLYGDETPALNQPHLGRAFHLLERATNYREPE